MYSVSQCVVSNQNHMNTTVCKLPDDMGGGYCRLWVEWNPSNFKIVLLQSDSAWSGHVRLFTSFFFSFYSEV